MESPLSNDTNGERDGEKHPFKITKKASMTEYINVNVSVRRGSTMLWTTFEEKVGRFIVIPLPFCVSISGNESSVSVASAELGGNKTIEKQTNASIRQIIRFAIFFILYLFF